MSNGESAMDGSLSNEELNESEMESDKLSDDDVDEMNTEKLDPDDRELYEKLKRQEREEREEIEKELKAHEEALIRRQEEIRVKELRLHAERLHQQAQERGQDLRINKHDDIRSLATRDNGVTHPDTPPRLDLLHHNPFLPDRGYTPRSVHTPHTPLTPHSNSQSPTEGPTHHWTFEEQFKQEGSTSEPSSTLPKQSSSQYELYELSDDPKRKEFLDDLFAFMQKRGTPVNRIPIMAKQTLDLYELFRLVVSKGGLVEVINKKLWREITKGLNLPSSITSAAFTLRTQYMKYLYPYECEKLKLSSPQELQAAIDGNRREGRRSSYGYDLSPGPTLIPTAHPHHLNGGMINSKLGSASSSDRRSPISSLRHLWQLQTHHMLGEDESLPPNPSHHRSLTERLTERDALAMEAASRAMEEATRKMEEASRAALAIEEPPRKRLLSDEERLLAHAGMPNAHLKITSRNDGRSEIDNSLVVSMEINGIMYQGVLFAHNPRRI